MTRQSEPPQAAAHGKLILFGEHAVVHGTPALAMPCALGLHACATERRRVQVPALDLSASWEDERDAVRIPFAVLRDAGIDDLPGILVEGDLIPGVGLGYSAAYSLTIARLMSLEGLLPANKVQELATAMENRFHGGASGLDLATAAAGSPLRFQRCGDSFAIEAIEVTGAWQFVVAVFPVSRTTKELVAMVRKRHSAEPVVRQKISRLGEIADLGTVALRSGDQSRCGELMNEAQGLLDAIGVSHAVLNQACDDARAAGALGAKLSGAGGGGALLALVTPERAESVQKSLELLNPLVCFEQRLG